MTIVIIMLVAFSLDYLFCEVKRFHPLVGFGYLTSKLEKKFNSFHQNGNKLAKWIPRLLGTFSWSILCLPLPIIYYYSHQNSLFFWCLDALILYVAVGLKSLESHALQIHKPLDENNLVEARHFCSYLVSRQTDELSEQEISRATVESVLENGHDAAIASFVWFMIGGAPLVILHRLANTLDAMWGYKNQQYLNFGWCAARMDDLLGWPSAKITALLYACQTNFSFSKMALALRNGFQQSQRYKSLNGGWVMATGASVLHFKLGGLSVYHGKPIVSVTLGCGETVVKNDILRSIKLVNRAVVILIMSALAVGVAFNFYGTNM